MKIPHTGKMDRTGTEGGTGKTSSQKEVEDKEKPVALPLGYSLTSGDLDKV